MTDYALVLSCEHGGARVPRTYQRLFDSKGGRDALRGHRGCDIGALRLARSLEGSHRVPLFASTVTRLLVDLNRSLGHPHLFSEFTRDLDPGERLRLLDRHYVPHRTALESWIDGRIRQGYEVLHLGVHSFVPRINGRSRTADVGLLYDPSRASESRFCARWKSVMHEVAPALRVRRNYPYLGKADGLTTHLRRVMGPRHYLGIELEVNQRVLRTVESQRLLARVISDSLRAALPGTTAKPAR
jgi:predicted N-formylglutamate amidohydrolase